MKTVLISAILALGISGAAHAQSVNDCEWQSSAWNLVEPWEENSRVFSNGKTRLAVLDTIEPAAGAFHLLILSPPYDELGGRQCKIVSWSQGIGFVGINFNELVADYNPAQGLLFDVPVRLYDPESSFTNGAILHLVLNQATGSITIDMELGRE